jgi:hypothetical protein
MLMGPVQLLPNYAPESTRNGLKTAVEEGAIALEVRHLSAPLTPPGCPNEVA